MSTTDEEPCIRPGKRLKRCVESESEEEEEVLGVVSDKVSPPVTPPPMEPTPDRGAVLLHEKFDLTHNTILAIVKHLGGPKPDDRAEVSSNLLRGRFRGAQSYSFPYPGWDPRLKHYQLAGVHWMLTLHSLGVNGILADEMGLGKTAQSCAFLALLFEKKLVQHPAIVCCPATLIDNWLKELETWGKGLRVLKWHGPKETKFRAIEVFESGTDVDVVLTSFQTLSASWDRNMFFKGKQFSYLVVDEAHLLKNADSQMYRNLNQGVRFQNRLLLTGSPVQNSVSELRNLLLFLMSDRMTPADLDLLLKYFSKHDTIAHPLTGLGSEVISPVDSPSVALQGSLTTMARTRKRCRPAVPEVECLQLLVSPYILRRLKSDVLFDLPAKHLRVERCEMVGRQLQLYREAIMSVSGDLTQSIAQMMPKVRRKPDENEAAVPKTFVRSLCHRLRRICNHSLLYRGYFTVDQYRRLVDHYHQHVTGFADKPREKVEEFLKGWSDFEIHIEAKEHGLDEFIIPLDGLLSGAKIQSLLPIVDEITGQGRKALIFSQFTTFLDLIEEVLLLHRPDVGFFRLDGNTEIGLRQDMVDTFDVNKHISLFLLSTRAGGVGLNLTAADTVILMDQDYNPHNDRQAEDRVHRLGQTSEVTVIRLCCKGTLEESILRCCQRKLDLDQAFGGSPELLSAALLQDSLLSADSEVKLEGIAVEEPVVIKKTEKPKSDIKATKTSKTGNGEKAKTEKTKPRSSDRSKADGKVSTSKSGKSVVAKKDVEKSRKATESKKKSTPDKEMKKKSTPNKETKKKSTPDKETKKKSTSDKSKKTTSDKESKKKTVSDKESKKTTNDKESKRKTATDKSKETADKETRSAASGDTKSRRKHVDSRLKRSSDEQSAADTERPKLPLLPARPKGKVVSSVAPFKP